MSYTNSRRLKHDAAKAVLELSGVRDNEALGLLLKFLLATEPVVDELPSYFLPPEAEASVGEEAVYEVVVAGKLVCAHVRWLDELADSAIALSPPGAVHGLSEAIAGESQRRLVSVLAAANVGADTIGEFLSTLAVLHSRHAASLALDGGAIRIDQVSLGLEDYVEHSKARAAPMLVPLEALFILTGYSTAEADKTRSCFELLVAALQLYDDALDIEEDRAGRRLSWVVSETAASLGERAAETDADGFYEAALRGGFLEQDLLAAEKLFLEALVHAEGRLPRLAEYLIREAGKARNLRDDFAELVASATDERP